MVATKRSSYAISSHGRWRAARSGKIRTIRAPKKDYARVEIKGLVVTGKGNLASFHCLQGAAFPDKCGTRSAERPTWDHRHNDRDDPTYMHATNLRPASRSEQSLNKTTSDNWIEGRPRDSQGAWTPFRNSGRAAAKLRVLEPGKNWNHAHIGSVAAGKQTHHKGWVFRYKNPEKAVRTASSAPTEPQWRDEPEFADEQWARLEPLGDRRLRVTPERRDGSEGVQFGVDLHEFYNSSESEESDKAIESEQSDESIESEDDYVATTACV
jgi:hypothetical protein